jgi:hypothetical protein
VSEQQYQTINAGGELRVFACKPRTMPIGDERCCTGVVGVGAAPAVIQRKDWPKCVDLSVGVTEILNQKSTSLCHSFAGTQVNEVAHHLAGRKDVQLSAGQLAGQVTGYQNEGAGVDEVLAVLLKAGQCRRDTVSQFDYGGGWPAEAKQEALEYRLLDAWDCGHDRVFDAAVSNLIVANPVEIGTYAFGGGHAVAKLGYFISRRGLYSFGANSWGDWSNWSDDLLEAFASLCPDLDHSHLLKVKGRGYWVFSESQISNGLGMFGAFGVQSTVANKDDSVPEA